MSTNLQTLPGGERSEHIIDRQLRRTRRQVKLVDLAASTAELAAGLLGALLVLILIDHWLYGLGFWSRALACLLLVTATGWHLARNILPLVIRPISPFYAARTIEQSTPTLKNSLLNFLFFRSQPVAIPERIYQTLQERAAADLRQVPVEVVVDRTRLIITGYILAGVLALGAIYAIASPKDPFQTIQRVSMPWADIARPARVEIADIQPGDAEAFQGREVDVSAIVRGVSAGEPVEVIYSTADGQAVDRPVAMRLDSAGLRHVAAVPPGGSGMQQDIEYRVRAGDALSAAYRLRVSPAPVVRVERLEYVYPAYMKRDPRTVADEGHVRAPEGTRVTIHARANYPIRSAWIEFNPRPAGAARDAAASNGYERVPMEFQGVSARREWLLELQPDRRTPRHATYQLSFVAEGGHVSENPLVYPIEVLPDLAPEIEILAPERDRTDVPENGFQKIELRALDPDFGLHSVRLRAVSGGVELINQTLLEDTAGRTGQVVTQHVFQPSQLGLTAGDEVVYWGVAEDNRTAPGSTEPAPNVQRTRNYQFRIVAARQPDGSSAPSPEKPAPKDAASSNDPSEKPQPGEKGGQGGTAGSGQSASSEGEPGGTEKGDPSGTGEGGSKQETAMEKGGQAEGGVSEPDASQDPSAGESSSAAGSGQAGAGQPEPGSGAAPDGGKPNEAQDDAGTRAPPHDGEVFEKALRRIREQQQSGETGQQFSPSQSDPADSSGTAGQDRTDGAGKTRGDGNQEPSARPGEGIEKPGSTTGDSPPSASPSAGSDESPQTTDASPETGRERPKQEPRQPESKGMPRDDGQSPADSAATPDGGQPSGADGAASKPGAGQAGTQPETGIPPEGANQDRDKRPDQGSQSTPGNEASPASQSQKQSDSSGQSTGDRSGGGEQGPGQSSRQPEGNSPGSTSASDDGAGAAEEAGEGPLGKSPGDQRGDGRPSGKPGEEQGPGSAAKPGGPRPDSAGPSSADSPPGDPSEQSPAGQGRQTPAPGQGVPTGGGLPGDGPSAAPSSSAEVPDSEEANLEYARRVTDLVLERLSDQQSRPDQKLLEELRWTPDDYQRFLQRWSQLKQSAREGTEGQRDLDDTLRGLGLRPPRDRLREGKSQTDQVRGLRDSGLRSSPPPQYLEQFDAFKKGTARTQP